MSTSVFVPDETLRDRLLQHSERAPDGCLLWTSVKSNRGYGLVKNGPKKTRRMVSAHRASFAVFVRLLAAGEHVLHRCDTPACIEPTHLFVGDHRANMHDMASKGRRTRVVVPVQMGSNNSQSRLTEADVREMRSRRAAGALLRELADEYGVSVGTISGICSRRRWQHVA